ncbi:MAG: S8 family serine peptidase [Actinobacteria bacterium]|nr:S8 family serine peptidase [Actinomycetota bacterium]
MARISRTAVAVATLLVLGGLFAAPPPATTWIVGLAPGATAADLDAGRVTAVLDDLDVALVAADRLAAERLDRDPDTVFVAADRSLTPTAASDADALPRYSGGDKLGMKAAWRHGLTGAGATVALVDTGVSDHPDLAGRVIHGQNFAGDGTSDDVYGHGTVMAGLIAGDGTASGGRWMGAAPGASILSVKVAGADGATDVSQVLAALQWTVSHREVYGVDVLLLAYATDSQQSATVDPLAYAVQRVHAAGIVPVATAGNGGTDAAVTNPGAAPAALTVGAFDHDAGSAAAFSATATTVDGLAKPELLATGTHLVAPVDPSSTVATENPDALQDASYIRGSGTSHAAALVAGATAVLVQAHPDDDVDTIRARVVSGAHYPSGNGRGDGAGWFQWRKVDRGQLAPLEPAFSGDGSGSLQAARGTSVVYVDGEAVEGEVDVFGNAWDPKTWTSSSWNSSSWNSSSWNSSSWNSSSWNGSSWDSSSWNSSSWSWSSWASSTWNTAAWR